MGVAFAIPVFVGLAFGVGFDLTDFLTGLLGTTFVFTFAFAVVGFVFVFVLVFVFDFVGAVGTLLTLVGTLLQELEPLTIPTRHTKAINC